VSGELILSVDVSTTAAKAIAWDAAGRVAAEGRKSIALSNPEPDGYEQDPEEWWSASRSAIRDAVRSLGPRSVEVRAVAVTHQRETVAVTDAGGTPLCPGIVWMDARSRAQVKRAVSRIGADRIHSLSGKPPCTTPSLYKLMWLFDTHPEILARRPRVLDVHAFMIQRLTGRFATSLASADPMGLVDMAKGAWSGELLDLAGIGEDQMPDLVRPGDAIGTIDPIVARDLDLSPGVIVVAGAGDGQAAELGAGVAGSGRAYLNLGTAVVSGISTTRYAVDRAFRTLYGASPGSYLLETDLKGGTFTVSWLVDRWLLSRASGETAEAILAALESEASQLSPGSDGLVLLPYWNGVMNPYWDDDATGAVIGWHGAHGPAHMYRAILEGIAFEQRLAIDSVERGAGAKIDEMVVMGGGSKSDLFCQIAADVIGRQIVRASSQEATSLGAAILGAVAIGSYPDVRSAARAMTSSGSVFEPGPVSAFYEDMFQRVYAGLYPAVERSLRELAALRTAGNSLRRGPQV
jgi:xylulokinase